MQVGAVAGWKHDLFDCTPLSTCCMGTCLPCIRTHSIGREETQEILTLQLVFGQTADRLRHPNSLAPDGLNSECKILFTIEYLTGCGWMYVLLLLQLLPCSPS